MTLHRVYALTCDGCERAEIVAPLRKFRRQPRGAAVERFRRWARRHAWRRTAGRDLCPTCAADASIRARLAKRPAGMF